MSWGIVLVKVPDEVRTLSELPKDYSPPPLGTLNDILEMLKELLPDVDFSNPSWGILGTEKGSIEFSIGDKDPVESIVLYIRGEVIDIICKLCKETSWQAFDSLTGYRMYFGKNGD
ncbi:hypothetical protein [Pseudobacteroides cellulosolvens]|uniref:Uncharacterized protein n=1 Tax=Pseudobacteroides cellulosolvens ATCC 35603 = DSM 2933 TaxID=398512 RepID=A0A0L6JKF6_9FIRM|nr:hypothetical protein [Pseudobacteroides cellulosolvens]KNY25862.1 hypothetical protein Bccel_1122 [Pseudobacteroides cellulosolvens ATCC 35603 = DSM 2933]